MSPTAEVDVFVRLNRLEYQAGQLEAILREIEHMKVDLEMIGVRVQHVLKTAGLER